MSNATATAAPLRYRGYNSQYVDIAIRNEEHLGFAMEYAVHPTNVGYFIVRFIVHGTGIDPKNYTHLTYREKAKFIIPATEEQPTAEVFKGLRLNKVAIPVFKPAIQRYEVEQYGDQFNIWAQVAGWVTEQVLAEGFTITIPNLQDVIRSLVILPVTKAPVESVVDFPKLDAPEQQAAALKLVQKPEPDEDDEADEDDDDGDDDSDKKDWLN